MEKYPKIGPICASDDTAPNKADEIRFGFSRIGPGWCS
jgi:hypothetical protein